MGNHKMIIYEPKGIFKTALKVGIGIKLGLELGDFIYYIALKTMWYIPDSQNTLR